MNREAEMHQWSYGTRNDQFEGPVSEAEFIAAIKTGTVQPTTKVNSITRTDGKWVQADQIPVLKTVFDKLTRPIEPPIKDVPEFAEVTANTKNLSSSWTENLNSSWTKNQQAIVLGAAVVLFVVLLSVNPCLAILAGPFLIGYFLYKHIMNAHVAYENALAALKTDPNNASLHQEALRLGRKYAELTKKSKHISVNELTIRNDIAAASAGRGKK